MAPARIPETVCGKERGSSYQANRDYLEPSLELQMATLREWVRSWEGPRSAWCGKATHLLAYMPTGRKDAAREGNGAELLAAADAAGLQTEGLPVPGLHRVKRGLAAPRELFFYLSCSFFHLFSSHSLLLSHMASSAPTILVVWGQAQRSSWM